MGSNRRMISRRTVVGLFIGMVIGFNLASWIAMPGPSHTDIEIEVIAAGLKDAQFRLGSARVRRNRIGVLRSGRDCNHDVIDYGANLNVERIDERKNQKFDQENPFKDHEKSPDDNSDAGERLDKSNEADLDALSEFELEEERRKRQKELERFYESDVGEEENEEDQESDMLEDFQYPVNVKKYVDYDAEMTSQSEKRKLVDKRVKERNRLNSARETTEDPRKNQVASPRDSKHFIYIGVLTARKYLATRGRAIMDTWAKKASGKVEFYVGEGVENPEDGGPPLPLVKLKNVKDDAYPPQKKSFRLLKNMYDAYLNSGYQWFMRADDDVYVKTGKLEKFLRTLNSSQPIFLGQTGLGNVEERGRLSLPHGDNYCMGGPGMIFSREVLRRVGPHIRNCVRFLFTWHEDVELSRCIRRYADVNCAWSYQMQELFYEHYSLRKGYIDPYEDPTNKKLYSSFTLHPNKNPHYQVKLHKFMRSQQLQQLARLVRERSRDVVKMDSYLETTSTMEDFMLGVAPSLNRYIPRDRDQVRPWDFMTERLWYAHPPSQARRTISSDRHVAIKDLVLHIMQSMNANSKSKGRIIDFKQVAYGYHRVNPLYGAEYVLDVLLLYRRFRGKPISIPVRRHAYLQQTFARTVLHESTPLDVSAISAGVRSLKPGLIGSVLSMLKRHSDKLLGAIRLRPETEIGDKNGGRSLKFLPSKDLPSPNVLRIDTGKFTAFSKDSASEVATVNIVIPLKGRHETFRSFMAHLEKTCLMRGDPVSLLIILFTSKDSLEIDEDQKTKELLEAYAKRYKHYELRLIPISGVFSRGLGLEIGASHFSGDSLLFFCDIDVVFDEGFTRKCRANTIAGSQVYYPVLFSEFHPNFESVWSLEAHLSDPRTSLVQLQNISALRRSQQRDQDHFRVAGSRGYWRNYGFGLLCAYKEDFSRSGGFDTTIQGWGMEDVDLIDKFIGGRARAEKGERKDEKTRRSVRVFRAFDSSLVHVYHPSHCDSKLSESQLRMCRASRASGVSSVSNLARAWSDLQMKKNDTGPVQDPVADILPKPDDVDWDDGNVRLKEFKKEKSRRKRRTRKLQSFNFKRDGVT